MKRLYEVRRDGVLTEGPFLAENVCDFYLRLFHKHGYKRVKDVPEAQRSEVVVTVHVSKTGEIVSATVSDDKTRARYEPSLPWFDAEGRQVKAP